MSESTKVMRPLAGALVALLGLSGPAWATYGGGACHSCARRRSSRPPATW